MLLGAVACCGIVALLIPGAKWQKHESAKGGFKVELPAPPRQDINHLAGVKQDPGTTTEGTILPGRLEVFAVVYRDIPPIMGRWINEEQVLDEIVKELEKDKEVLILHKEPITVNGFPGREVEFRSTDGGVYVARFIIADTRIYTLLGGGQYAKQNNPNVRRFLDSFEITDPNLVAAGKKKAADAQAAADKLKKQQEQEEDERIAKKLAEEKAERERLHRQKVQRENMDFMNAPYDGPAVPEVSVVSRKKADAYGFAFEKEVWNGIQSGQTGVTLKPGVLGPGVRGNAAYLLPDTQPASFTGMWNNHAILTNTIREPAGFTLAGWVRVRYAPVTVVSVGPPDRQPVAEVTVNRTHIVGHVAGLDKPFELKHPWTRDDKWHHVALVRDKTSGPKNVKLYFDGVLVASGSAEMVPLPAKLTGSLGWLKHKPDPNWPLPLDVDGKPTPATTEQIVGAIDECAFFGRALTDAEVRVLCGKDLPPDISDRPSPPPPIDIKLTAGKKLDSVAFIAFDVPRGVVWVVDRVEKGKSNLRKLSYPDFEEKASYELSGSVTAGAFDLPRNRLFLAVVLPGGEPKPETQERISGGWPLGIGFVHRYDLDDLPKDTQPIKPEAESIGRLGIYAMEVAPDGQMLYFTGAPPAEANLQWQRRVLNSNFYRISTELNEIPQRLLRTEEIICPHRFELSPDGSTIHVFAWVPNGNGLAVYEIDTQKWQTQILRDSAERPFDWVSVSDKRMFICGFHNKVVSSAGKTGVTAFNGMVGEGGERHLGVLANSHYLLIGDGTRVRVYSTYGRNEKPGEWKVWAQLNSDVNRSLAGSFWVSPDGKFIVFRSGQIVNVESTADLTPDPAAVKRTVALPPPKVPLAPRPRVKVIKGSVPSASNFSGLKLYLDCDRIVDGQVIDAVSGKPAGKFSVLTQLVDGPRGKALRLTNLERGRPFDDEKWPNLLEAANSPFLIDPTLFRIPADKPFTIAFWARNTPESQKQFPTGVFQMQAKEKGALGCAFHFDPERATYNIYPTVNGRRGTAKLNPQVWHHFTVTRDERGQIQVLLNGENWPDAKPVVLRDALDCEVVAFAMPTEGEIVVEIDEFCLFDRVLTEEEVSQLAGRGEQLPKKPKPKAEPASGTDGLRFHLAFDELKDGTVKESVSGKFIGKSETAALIDGPRGKALRLSPKWQAGRPPVSGLMLDPELLRIPAKKPFTFALWARSDPKKPGRWMVIQAIKKERGIFEQTLYFELGPRRVTVDLGDRPAVSRIRGLSPEWGDWDHYVFMRNEKNELRLFIDGVEEKAPKPIIFEGALEYASFDLAVAHAGAVILDIDEFCLFDRALTDDEVKQLAGRAKK